jgi:hypothetical protein
MKQLFSNPRSAVSYLTNLVTEAIVQAASCKDVERSFAHNLSLVWKSQRTGDRARGRSRRA